MEYSATSLLNEFETLLDMIDKQIETVTAEATRMEISPLAMRTQVGGWVMSPLLTTKAQVLIAILGMKKEQERNRTWLRDV